jgi:hypothetical protein
MRITKTGCLPGRLVYNSKCGWCSTEFEYKQEEGHITYDQRDGDYIVVACPFCRRMVSESVTAGVITRDGDS